MGLALRRRVAVRVRVRVGTRVPQSGIEIREFGLRFRVRIELTQVSRGQGSSAASRRGWK